MPKFNKKSDEEIIEKEQVTNSGIYVTAGDIQHSDFDDKSWIELQQDYTNMINGEPIISRCSKLLKTPILQSEFRIESGKTDESKECADFIQHTFDKIKGGFQTIKYHKLLSIDYGMSIAEMIFKRADKFNNRLVNRLIKLNFFQNETINKFYYDESGEFIGIEHDKRIPEGSSSYINIIKGENGIENIEEKLSIFSFQEEFNDIRGKSLLRPLRLAWDSKIKVIQAMVRACQRGAGIPVIETVGKPSPSDQALISTIGNTLTFLNNGYVAYDKNTMSVRLEELKGQKDNLGMLEFFNRELFFGMMLEFSTSGIGGAGSRAATESHKSAYELQANYILQLLEENIKKLIDIIIFNSPFKLVDEEKPILKFNSITQVDTFRLAQTMRNMYDSMIITKHPEDENYFREIFGIPQIKINTETTMQEASKKLSKKEVVKRELSKYELEIFELESAEEGYLTAKEESEKTIQDVFHRILLDISKGSEKYIRWSVKLEEELITKLQKLYSDLYNRGRQDIEKEISKHRKTVDYKLAVEKNSSVNNSISRFTKKFLFNVKTYVEDSLEKTSGKKSFQEIVLGYEDGFKNDKRELLKTVEDGYTDGRGFALDENKDLIDEYIYTAILDKNLCDECAPLDNLTFTIEELEAEGLKIGTGRVNPNCLGHDNCRCQIGIYSLK